jgi:hypothetical protein
MPSRNPVFPFPALPAGEVSPSREAGHWYDLVRRDSNIITWFIEEQMRRTTSAG